MINVAALKIRADKPATTTVRETVAPPATSAFGIAGDDFEELFRSGSFLNTAHQTRVLEQATDSVRGPHGGLVPSTRQATPTAGVTRVDSEVAVGFVTTGRELATPARQARLQVQSRLARFLRGTR